MSYSGHPTKNQICRQIGQSFRAEKLARAERRRRRNALQHQQRTRAAQPAAGIPAQVPGESVTEGLPGANETSAAVQNKPAARSQVGMSSIACSDGNPAADLVTLQSILNPDYLLATFDRLRNEKGQAAGIDGVRYDHLSRSEVFAALRAVAAQIRCGKYVPLPLRSCSIPKGNGRSRKLHLQAVVDRIVSAAIAELTSPVCEASYSDNSFGFRVNRNVLGLLARLESQIRAHDFYYVVELDVQDAFPSTAPAVALAELRTLPIEPTVIDLIRTIFNPRTEVNHLRGLPQGNPLSPQLFNLVLTRLLDRPLADSRDAMLLRYADNLVLAARSIPDVRSAQQHVVERLATTGYQLKTPTRDPHDVRDPANGMQILGYGLSYTQGEMNLHSKPASWQRLTDLLREAHQATYPAAMAKALVRGWLSDQGPTVVGADRPACVTRVRQLAASQGHRELGKPEDLIQSLEQGTSRWEIARVKEQERCNGLLPSLSEARSAPRP